MLADMRSHIVWSSDTTALGGKIAFEYATKGNLDALSLDDQFKILADPGVNTVGESISLVGVPA